MLYTFISCYFVANNSGLKTLYRRLFFSYYLISKFSLFNHLQQWFPKSPRIRFYFFIKMLLVLTLLLLAKNFNFINNSSLRRSNHFRSLNWPDNLRKKPSLPLRFKPNFHFNQRLKFSERVISKCAVPQFVFKANISKANFLFFFEH